MPSVNKKKRSSRLGNHKWPILAGIVALVIIIGSYGLYVGAGIWNMARYQADTESALRYRETLYRASDNLRRPVAVDFASGRQSVPAARLAFPATPELDLTYGLYDSGNDGVKTLYLSSNQGVESAKVASSNLAGSDQGEMMTSATQAVAQVQACRRQLTIALTPRGQAQVVPDGRNLDRQGELTLRDGRTAVIYRDTECRSDFTGLMTAAKEMTSF